MKYKDCKVGQRVVVKIGGTRWNPENYGKTGFIVNVYPKDYAFPIEVEFEEFVDGDLGKAKGLKLIQDVGQE